MPGFKEYCYNCKEQRQFYFDDNDDALIVCSYCGITLDENEEIKTREQEEEDRDGEEDD